MTEYSLPFTCKTRDKALWVYALIISPILGVIGFIGLYPDLVSNSHNHLIYLPLAIHICFFFSGLLIKAIENSEKFPTFKCKCETEEKERQP